MQAAGNSTSFVSLRYNLKNLEPKYIGYFKNGKTAKCEPYRIQAKKNK